MHCLSLVSNLFNLTPSTPKEGFKMIRNSFLTLVLGSFLVGCGLPISYDPCYTGTGCSQVADVDTDTTPPNNGGGQDTFSCEELTQLAVLACSGDIVSVDCVAQAFVCGDHNDDGSGGEGGDTTITIVITVEADGSVTAADDDPTTPDCADGVDNDFDGDIDFGSDTDCESATDISEAGSDGGSDTDSDGCVETAGGVEYCDGVDNDCDGSVDNGDFDGDGYISDDCTAYDGLDSALSTGDCNDSGAYSGWIHSALVHPSQLELGDWIDEDCNSYDEQGATEAEVEYDGCALQCNTDSSNPTTEFFETDGDVTDLECVSAFVVADESGDSNPLDETVSFIYGGTTYTGVAVTCEEGTSDQANPAMWDDVDDIKSAMCALTPAIDLATCLALF